ncbi:helix-turn-helix domain-containing protein [Desulfoluna spongiiphila]|uniref:helix-turn-helix domain-containing protein n=1 Tax=Desulfoluna spongiiphila TaxID=419481 RepID=UPI00125EEF35|nr:helix-turn-helix transcriptional regulator [Desulfoluna spongiiphila]
MPNSQLRTTIDRLKYLIDLKARGIAADFAREIGIAPATFHYYLKGRAPSFDVLKGMRNAYSVNINWFITGEGEAFGDESETSETLQMDLEVLHRIIKWVEEWLDREDKFLPPDKKARFIALAYEYFTTPKEGGDGRDVNDKDMNKWLRLVV